MKAQEVYYNKIVERYMNFCGASGGGDELERQFAALSIASAPAAPLFTKQGNAGNDSNLSNTLPKPFSGSASSSLPAPSTELSTILMAMRKLREAIVATQRRDIFAQRAYIFIIHVALLTKHFESYHPALLYLLYRLHPRTPLSEPELHEFVGYHILDLACRQGDLAAAFAVRAQSSYRDLHVDVVLKALTHDNWVSFWRVRRAVNGYQKRLIEWADDAMRLHALKCLGRSYITADQQYVERCAESTWPELKERGAGWELVDGAKIIIRRAKLK
jgi:hypothetical protein